MEYDRESAKDVENFGQDYNADRGIGQPSPLSAEPTITGRVAKPERELETGHPSLTGAAPEEEKKGMGEKVKGLVGGMKKHHGQEPGFGHHRDGSPYGTGAEDVAKHPYNKDSSYGTGASLDPTGPPAGSAFGEEDVGSADPDSSDEKPNQKYGAVTDEQGNIPKDLAKKDNFVHKIMDKLHHH